jgi:hypothetical protein
MFQHFVAFENIYEYLHSEALSHQQQSPHHQYRGARRGVLQTNKQATLAKVKKDRI